MSVWISLIPSLYRRRVFFFVLFPPFLRPPHLIHTWSISNSSRRCFSSVYKSLRVSSPLQFRTDYPRNISLISIGIEVKNRGRIITRGSSHFEPIKKIVFIENPKVHRVRYVDDTRCSVRIYFWTFYSLEVSASIPPPPLCNYNIRHVYCACDNPPEYAGRNRGSGVP